MPRTCSSIRSSGIPISEEKNSYADDWRTIGARDVLQAQGLAWLHGVQTAVLSVPSAVVPAERNYLINPRHPDFARVLIGAPQSLQTDTRLLRNLAGQV